MQDKWYYSHGVSRLGPFSGQQLKDLADLGSIVRTDTIWKEGVDKGVLASRVKHLFARPEVSVSVPLEASVSSQFPATALIVENSLPVVELEPSPLKTAILPGKVLSEYTVTTSTPLSATAKPAKNGRALAMKGADIISQDGSNARYRKKCTVCGHKDSALQSIIIANMTTNAHFYCPKCKKNREVTIRCTMG